MLPIGCEPRPLHQPGSAAPPSTRRRRPSTRWPLAGAAPPPLHPPAPAPPSTRRRPALNPEPSTRRCPAVNPRFGGHWPAAPCILLRCFLRPGAAPQASSPQPHSAPRPLHQPRSAAPPSTSRRRSCILLRCFLRPGAPPSTPFHPPRGRAVQVQSTRMDRYQRSLESRAVGKRPPDVGASASALAGGRGTGRRPVSSSQPPPVIATKPASSPSVSLHQTQI